MAAVAAGFIVVLGIEVYLANQPTAAPVAFDVSKLNNKSNVATGEPIEIPFSGPVDKAAVEIQIEPATSFTQQWVGQTLVIVPDHQLAPNTTYTVTVLSPSAPPQTVILAGWPVPGTAIIGGLANGAPYTFYVSATNRVGTGPLSIASASVGPGAFFPMR